MIKDKLGYNPKVTEGMLIPDFEDIVHNTIKYIEEKYPDEKNTMDRWCCLIGEEFGELCKAINDGEINNTLEEGTQIIAAIYLMLRDFVNSDSVKHKLQDKDSVAQQVVSELADAFVKKHPEYKKLDVERLLKVKVKNKKWESLKNISNGLGTTGITLLIDVISKTK